MALTRNDIKEVIEEVVKEEMGVIVDQKIDPLRREILDKMDELIGEVKNYREENDILDGRTSNHEERLNDLEKIHPAGQHSSI